MLYLRNTNQLQSTAIDIKRGTTNSCCTPTLNSVTSASFTQLTIDSSFGVYLINCKSCVGGYIQVTEDSGSTWTTINPGNCSTTNLVPMPSQSAYYRTFTSCSTNNQPFDPLTSSFSNEILYIPNSRLHYKFDENLGSSRFTIAVTGSTILDATASVTGDFYEIPSASAVSESLQVLSVPYTGSLSMSLLITGSNVSYYTSSCVLSTSSIFIGSYKAIPNEDYYTTASIDYNPGRQDCGTNLLPYTVYSCDVDNQIWYPANQWGTFTSQSTNYGFITGSITRTNVETNDCRYNALRLSGSATFQSTQTDTITINVVTGSVTAQGLSDLTPGGSQWTLTANADSSSFTFNIGNTNYDLIIPASGSCKNKLLSIRVEGNVGPVPTSGRFTAYVNGVSIGTEDINQITTLGSTYILSSNNGALRTHGNNVPDSNWITQYNCYYDL